MAASRGKPGLRVAKPGEAPPAKPGSKTLKQAVEGSERDVLVTLRAKLAAEVDGGVPPAYLAPISRQLREIDREIRALDARAAEEAGEDADEDAGDETFDASTL